MASVAIHNAWLYEEGQTARAAAEAANAAKDEFLTMLAHELRNPLGVILNGVSVLDRHGSRAPESIRVRDLIRHHTRHLARLLDDLLDLARISQGKIPLRSEVLDLRAVVDITVQAYRDGVEARGQKVSVSMPDVAVYVYGDRTRLQQITGNLLDNASRYTPAGGSVWVSVEEINDEVLLSVRDNGIGIPPDKLESIFELFTQLDVSVACSEGGLGIGLALVRRLTEMHGGRVHAHSDGRGSGSEFVVRLRRARPPVAAHAPTPPRARRAYDILLVEDNSAARETLRFVLELEGHRVQIAADGLGGVDAGVRRRPDVAFVDIGLPGLDGYEVGRRLRAVHGDGVRLFAITGYGRPEDIRRARHAGFDGHLTKPVEVDEVLRVLGSL
jgi:CheY-like chemotaxis protein